MSFRMLVSAVVTAIWSTIPLACKSPYTYLNCDETEDCHSGVQNVPGTVCVEDVCKCQDRSEVICCDFRRADDPDCKLACRPCWECPEGTKGCEGADFECRLPADCPPVPTTCPNVSACQLGRCWYTFQAGTTEVQKVGDCMRRRCDGKGVVEHVVDFTDTHDDGNDCTLDQCDETGPTHTPHPDGTGCRGGYCVRGRCVECIRQSDCEDLPDAVCQQHKCVPASCVDTRLGDGETDTDCGGPCVPCADGLNCKVDADCSSGACKSGRCVASTASDGRANGSETDVDCGGPDAPPCSDGKRCAYHRDCMSGVCIGNICRPPTCTDGTHNGTEEGVDCGGSCPVACE